MKKICFFFLLLTLIVPATFAQIGGNNTYEFLNLSPSARATALGGIQIAAMDDDASLAFQNPSLYNENMHSQLSVNTVAYLADINYGYVSYTHDFDSLFTGNFGIQYISYGDFTQTDPTGQVLGSFKGGEYALTVGGARKWKNLSYGANLKFIMSSLESYNSVGLAADLAATYYKPEKEWGLALVVKNIGGQLTAYEDTKEAIPFEIQLGFSKKLKYLPLRLSIIAQHLQKWDIRYDDPNVQTTSFFGEDPVDEGSHVIDIFFRHLVFSGELFLGKNVRLRVGYNHLRRQELALDNQGGFSGLSFGGGIRITKFQINYGYAGYHPGSAAHHFSINTKISDFGKK